MTTKDMATRTGGAIDFTMMHVTHDAFRHDSSRCLRSGTGAQIILLCAATTAARACRPCLGR